MILTKKSACIETIFTEVPFEERIQLAKDFGFEYIEFWTWKDKDINKIRRLCEKTELKVASFSGDQDFSLIDENESEKYISFVKESIETAKCLNCHYLVLHSNALGEGGTVLNPYNEISDYKKFNTMFNVLKDLAPIAEKEKVILVLEALNTKIDHVGNFLAYTKDAAEVVKLVNSPYIKILYDVYHMQIMEGNIINTLKKYIDIIGYIHIADVPGRHEPGTGEINFINIIEALRLLKYNGIIGFELFPSRNSKEAVEIIKKL
ncbi:hydroxypyruvate isomerase family protein [Neomoorella thermoacetica]|uniref:hydroxypyruvate isomerase family protein n=1 Tax=Neomoorella thermoacetica TaxID=1525 RepID=UPI0008FA6149|nr:TIM barrel protein [Moorella thermoacetica]OIQ11008.1 hydroxypyruvate isomerase [Moorella thermoacetica]